MKESIFFGKPFSELDHLAENEPTTDKGVNTPQRTTFLYIYNINYQREVRLSSTI